MLILNDKKELSTLNRLTIGIGLPAPVRLCLPSGPLPVDHDRLKASTCSSSRAWCERAFPVLHDRAAFADFSLCNAFPGFADRILNADWR